MPRPVENVTEPLAAPGGNGSLVGRTLGKFELVELLGKGGSGEVFRATQTSLGRSAVIKVLRREVAAAPNRVERFLREAKLASRLDHPYAAHIYAFGAESDGVLWIAMEHVKGVTLDELITDRGPMPAAVFAPLFGRLCEVVHTAHELGMVHRDIKAANVMVLERAGQLLPKLLDFGIAKGLDDETTPGIEGMGLTGHGAMLGSPHYMSPEQWVSPNEVDRRADIYALGVLAYRCMTGVLPFAAFGRTELPQAHRELAPPPLPPSVAAPVASAILTALAKDRDDRWASALELGTAITRAVGAATTEAVPIFDGGVREAWTTRGPQPIADAMAQLARAATTVEADAALRELVAITCRWLAVLALVQVREQTPEVGEAARVAGGSDRSAPWVALARVATPATASSALAQAVRASAPLEALAAGLDDRDHARTASDLARDLAAAAEALHALDGLLSFVLVVGRAGGAEKWQGPRRRERERVVVWGEPLPDGEVALLDEHGNVAARLSPLVQVLSPLPAAEPELFFLWSGKRGHARLVAAPWGFERDDEAAARRLDALTTEEESAQGDGSEESPYAGLAAYRTGDGKRFVGREREIEALANRLVRASMLAVLGPSGVGKSSFIHAGVMARLAEHYELISMRPGRQPLHTLASLPAINGDASHPDDIITRLRALGDRAPRGVVLVIDQFEELVTLCHDPLQRRTFAEVLASAADDTRGSVRVVVTVRDDFASMLESEPAFHGRFDVFVLGTPPEEALRRIVTLPASRAGVTVDPEVVDDMVAEVVGRPGSLPLLSFTAAQLWKTRDRTMRKITREAYRALGGVAGALSTYADQIYGNLARRDQEAVRSLFARLVAADGTRVPSPRRELEQLPDARGVLAHLIDARLLVVREDDGADIVEIVHECLAERWERLARWRTEDAADRALLADVRIAARRWDEAGRRADLLARGEALLEHRKLATRAVVLTDVERAFIAAAVGAERRTRRLRALLVAGAMTVLAGAALVMAYLRHEAQQSRRTAEHSAVAAHQAAQLAEERLTAGLVAQGRRELNDNRSLAALAYFAEALRRGADSPGLRFMIAIASRGFRDEELVIRDSRTVAIASLDEGFVVGSSEGRLRFFDAKAQPVGELAVGIRNLSLLHASGDRMLAIGDGGVGVVDIANRTLRTMIPRDVPVTTARFGPEPDELTIADEQSVTTYALDGIERRRASIDLSQSDGVPLWGDGTTFLALGTNVELLDLRTMQRRTIATEVWSGPEGSSDHHTIAYLDQERRVHLLDGTGAPRGTFVPQLQLEAVFLSADGERIGGISDRTLAVFDRTGKLLRTVPLVHRDEERIFRLRDDELWTASTHGVIRHYKDARLVASIPAHTAEVEDLRLAGAHVVSAGFDGAVVVQRAASEQLVVDPPPCEAGSFGMNGPVMMQICEGDRATVFYGRQKLGTTQDYPLAFTAYEPRSGRTAMVGTHITVAEPDGRILATLHERRGGVAFEDADHLVIIELADPGRDAGLWRFTLSTQQWERLATLQNTTGAIALASGGIFVATATHIVRFTAGAEAGRLPLANAQFFSVSGDLRYVAAHLGDGSTAVLDGVTGALERQLEPVESYGVAAALDKPGDLIVRTSRGTLTVWERTTGDNLLWTFDLLREGFGAAFAPDGRIEVMGSSSALLDIPRETRPVAEILRSIDCRVPLRVTGSRLEPAPVRCEMR
ncbi:MAG: protein kinase [Kofleriaceae bacterium]|nr:protein kinase [Kofleriaceae bacterium]